MRDKPLNSASLVRLLNSVDWDFSDYVPNVNTQGINALHWYPAPFPAALAGTLADILNPGGGLFVDPFCGSGVGVIEAWLRGHRTVGIDSNFWATQIVSAKVQLLCDGTIEHGFHLASSYEMFRAKNVSRWSEIEPSDLANHAGMLPESTKWFDPITLCEMACAKEWIATASEADTKILRVLFSSLLQRSSLLRDVHYTYIVDRSRTTTAPTSKVEFPVSFSAKIRRSFRDAEFARSEYSTVGVNLAALPIPRLIHGKAEEANISVSDKIDLVITSPPYFGMNDYVRSQYLSYLIDPWESFDKDLVVEAGSRRGRRSKDHLDLYMTSMRLSFKAVAENLSNSGHLAVVLGGSKSKLASSHDLVAEVRDMVCAVGLQLVWEGRRQIRYRKINSGGTSFESIWVFSR